MIKRLLASILICGAVVGTGHAGLFVSLLPEDNSAVLPSDDPAVPDFNDGSYFTFDLHVQPFQQDTWLAAYLSATIDGPAVFFQHPLGGDGPPDPGLVSQYPALEFDSYFTTPVGGQPLFPPGEPPENQASAITAHWAWDGPTVDGSSGPFARVTARWLGGAPATLTFEGECWAASMGGFGIPFSFTATIPEPGSLLLLAVGALLVARCRA
jgi:hypothetical protein